ncbi:MAG: hypothetical protein HFI26_10500 [Lachnospiraceae bacterium]|jgi:hypothetical protein|nr:hypothetical protein [Lachnospiraceae bacterium]
MIIKGFPAVKSLRLTIKKALAVQGGSVIYLEMVYGQNGSDNGVIKNRLGGI